MQLGSHLVQLPLPLNWIRSFHLKLVLPALETFILGREFGILELKTRNSRPQIPNFISMAELAR
jgi:hypothetical protein